MSELPGEIKRVAVLAGLTLEWGGTTYKGPYWVPCLKPEGHSGISEMTHRSEFDLDQASAYELFILPKPIIRIVKGGEFSIVRKPDNYHQLEPWVWSGRPNGFATSDKFVRVEFLQDFERFLCKTGDRRRLRLSIVKEFPHKYQDSPEYGPNYAIKPEPSLFLIKEDRPRRPSDDALLEEQLVEAQRRALSGPSWMGEVKG